LFLGNDQFMTQKNSASAYSLRSPYDPAALLDALVKRLQLNSDHALSRKLKVTRQIIANIRSGTLPIGASMLLWMHEASGISIDELRHLMGDRRATCRLHTGLSRASIHRRAG
jgi:transcriptional regulator with XRE-family HTH domain